MKIGNYSVFNEMKTIKEIINLVLDQKKFLL